MHLISGLGLGGAEQMLYKLLSNLDRKSFDSEVVCLTGPGPLGEQIAKKNIPVSYLNMSRGIPDPRGIWKLARKLRMSQPDLLQTWMYHADLMGSVAARLTHRSPVIWNIRNGNLDQKFSKWTTKATVKICARISESFCERIICCARSAAKIHADLGYAAQKMTVIPNGFDIDLFKPDYDARLAIRSELGIPEDSIVIGLVARFDPQKDHRNFLNAASRIKHQFQNVYFILCGHGTGSENQILSNAINSSGLANHTRLLGVRNDVPKVTASFDIACSSSAYGEAFSNAIGEAMACGLPCVVTDVGDSRYIVGDSGVVVPPRNYEALYQALNEVICAGFSARRERGRRARQIIEQNFTLGHIVKQYEQEYFSVYESMR